MKKQPDQKNQGINERLVEELLEKVDPSELFGRDGLFQQLKKRVVERVLSGCHWPAILTHPLASYSDPLSVKFFST